MIRTRLHAGTRFLGLDRFIPIALAVVVATLGLNPAHAEDPVYQAITEEIYVEMDDGVHIALNVTYPSLDGVTRAPGTFPAYLKMTPYGKDIDPPPTWMVVRGYVRAQGDIRGLGSSEGTFDDNVFSPREARDMATIIDFLGEQEWSNGRVALGGGSYEAANQYLAAALRPEHLVAITPDFGLTDLYREVVYPGGIFSFEFGNTWLLTHDLEQTFSGPADARNREAALAVKPSHLTDESIAWDFYEHTTDGPFYEDRSPVSVIDQIDVPVMVTTGWFDPSARGLSDAIQTLLERDGVETVVRVDPLSHAGAEDGTERFPYPADNIASWEEEWIRFMDRHVKGVETPPHPKVKFYLMGRDTYVESEQWPPEGTQFARLYLGADGFTSEPQIGEENYLAKPTDGWTNILSRYINLTAVIPYAPLDQSLEAPNGLIWETEPLTDPLAVAGPMKLHLSASSTAPDTDFIVRVSDVAPDGSARLLSEGFLRASHRALDQARSRPEYPFHTHRDPAPLEPGTLYDFDIEVLPTANEFQVGHRMRLQLLGSDTPNHLPADMRVSRSEGSVRVMPHQPALNTVAYGPEGSYLLVPLLPAEL